MDLLAVHYPDAVQGFTLENIVDYFFGNIYKVDFTACCCFLAYDLFYNKIENLLPLGSFGKEYPKHTPLTSAQGQ